MLENLLVFIYQYTVIWGKMECWGKIERKLTLTVGAFHDLTVKNKRWACSFYLTFEKLL